jgi:hypothetical protein
MQKWEYRIITRTRQASENVLNFAVSNWNLDIASQLPSLGEDGWELVAISARSGQTGPRHTGTTTEEDWVFKRPKP